MILERERAELVEYARRLRPDGLCVGTAGNLSLRHDRLVAITPSTINYDVYAPELMCVVDLDGNRVEAPLLPSSELPMHLAVYRASAAQAIVHAHPPYATLVSTIATDLPGIHYAIATLGGRVRVAPYARYGTPELAAAAVAGLEGRMAVLLQNHGSLTIGGTLREAYERAALLEWLCQLYYRASLHGGAHLLSDDELAAVGASMAAQTELVRARFAPPPRED